jgi:acyl-CoA thioester hydrolase
MSFALAFEVRDYECDLQGIVNNAVYQNYLEHTRHQHLKSVGIDFAQLHEQDLDPIVYRIEIDYKKSLKSGDQFSVSSTIEREGIIKFVFHQQIYKNETELVLKAKVIAVFTSKGKPIMIPQEVLTALGL